MKKEIKIIILFLGIILTLFKTYWFLGMILMILGFYLLGSKEERNVKMEKEKFDQAKYMREWQKENMKQVKASYKTEFVDEFKEACKKLGIKQSDVIRKAMQDMIEKANNI